jgi:hypothetical protein
MARPKSEKKSDPAAPAERRILPMQLQVGDRLSDQTGDCEVIGRSCTSQGASPGPNLVTGVPS